MLFITEFFLYNLGFPNLSTHKYNKSQGLETMCVMVYCITVFN